MSIDQFKKNMIETAPPIKLVTMLYDGMLKFLEDAIELREEKKYKEVNEKIIRVQNIITELLCSLNMNAGAIAENLEKIYNFIYSTLVKIIIDKEKKGIETVIDLIEPLRDAWIQIEKEVTMDERDINRRKGGFEFEA